MHNLVIDIGNTNSKLGVFKQKELIYYQRCDKVDLFILKGLIEKYQIANAILSSVTKDSQDLIDFLKETVNYIPFSTNISTGISNHYQSLDTLGLDRWAKLVAANGLYKGCNCLLIDAGSCITYDLLNENSEYYGGSISLGIKMRFKALNQYTGKLPLVLWDKDETQIPAGTDTVNAIKNGVLQGVCHELEGFIAAANLQNKALKIILTGGDADFLTKQLKNTIFANQIIHEPYLVLKGLNEVITAQNVH